LDFGWISVSSVEPRISDLLNRPADQRAKEFKYRAAQSFVFGVPVLALQWLGPRLGGAESPRWIGILQALLSGWIIYIAAAGMLFEGLIVLRRRFMPDLLIAAAALAMYVYSLIIVAIVIFARSFSYPTLFHWAILLLLIWSAFRWWRLSHYDAAHGTQK
jgi:cation transport ATPase